MHCYWANSWPIQTLQITLPGVGLWGLTIILTRNSLTAANWESSTWQEGCCLVNIIVTGQWHFCCAGFVPVYQAVGELGHWNNPKQVSPGCSSLLASLWQLLSLLCISLPPWNAGGDTTYGEDQSWHSECPHNWGPSQSERWPCQRKVVLEKAKPPLQPSSPDDPTLLALLVPITSALSWCLYPQVQRSITQHHQKVEAIQGSMDEWINKTWSIHSMEYYSIIKGRKSQQAAMWMNLKDLKLSEIINSQRWVLHDST